MRFTVPQFIEHEAKIVGPLTFKQFIFVGLAGGMIFILYFAMGKTNVFLFLLLSILLLTLGLTFSFLKIGGRTLPEVLANVLKFSITPKMYIWKKKEQKIEALQRAEEKPAETAAIRDNFAPKMTRDGQLKKLSAQIDTKSK